MLTTPSCNFSLWDDFWLYAWGSHPSHSQKIIGMSREIHPVFLCCESPHPSKKKHEVLFCLLIKRQHKSALKETYGAPILWFCSMHGWDRIIFHHLFLLCQKTVDEFHSIPSESG